jgi:putative toxin-antitoxin system antitoxin component (TIGR02293 family)
MALHLNLGGYLGIQPTSDLDLARIVEQGLPLDSLQLLRDKGLTFTEVAELVISPRTVQHRKAKSQQLTHEETDKVVRIARILALADQVFGDREKALGWLRTQDERLGNRTALSLLQTESGGRLVEGMLWQIDEGIVS